MNDCMNAGVKLFWEDLGLRTHLKGSLSIFMWVGCYSKETSNVLSKMGLIIASPQGSVKNVYKVLKTMPLQW